VAHRAGVGRNVDSVENNDLSVHLMPFYELYSEIYLYCGKHL
jgi:hypothetical protein